MTVRWILRLSAAPSLPHQSRATLPAGVWHRRLSAMVRATTEQTLESLGVGEAIRQYPGQIQVTRAVKVKAPGKHFNNLRGAEAAADYWATAVSTRSGTSSSGTSRAGERRTQGLASASSATPTPSTTPTTRASGRRWVFGIAGGTTPTRRTARRRKSSSTSSARRSRARRVRRREEEGAARDQAVLRRRGHSTKGDRDALRQQVPAHEGCGSSGGWTIVLRMMAAAAGF